MLSLVKLKRAVFGGSLETLGKTAPQHGPGRPTPHPTAPFPTILNDGPRPSSSPAHCGEPQRLNGTTVVSKAISPPQVQPASPPAPSTQTSNVILFGEAGVGKSAVVNLIARQTVAKVSSNARGCTMQSTPHNVNVDGIAFRIFDTVGLNQGSEPGTNAHLDAIEHAYKLVCALKAAGGVHLLLFCMRGGSRVTHVTRSNYRLFAEFLCQNRVPVVIVITNLEQEERMEDWWMRNEKEIVDTHGIRNIGHACVTTLEDGNESIYGPANYVESRTRIRDVLKECCLSRRKGFQLETTNGVAMAAEAMRCLVENGRQPSRKDIEKMLSKRLRMSKEDVKKILDMMNKAQAVVA